jgi:hypothetical protein
LPHEAWPGAEFGFWLRALHAIEPEEHRADAAPLEHQHRIASYRPARIARCDLSDLFSQMDQDRAGLEQRFRSRLQHLPRAC